MAALAVAINRGGVKSLGVGDGGAVGEVRMCRVHPVSTVGMQGLSPAVQSSCVTLHQRCARAGTSGVSRP